MNFFLNWYLIGYTGVIAGQRKKKDVSEQTAFYRCISFVRIDNMCKNL